MSSEKDFVNIIDEHKETIKLRVFGAILEPTALRHSGCSEVSACGYARPTESKPFLII